MSILSLQSVGNYPSLLISYPPPNNSTIEEVTNFKFLLTRNSDELSVENGCRDLIKKYTEKNDWSSLYFLFCVIRETRECRQERLLTYIQLYVWYEIHPLWATSAFTDCIYSYGCWKDIKYFCEYCRKKSSRMDHPFILFSLCLLDQQLKTDWANYQSGHPPCEISYAAKWTPRENSKYGWFYTMLCASYFDFMRGAVTVNQNEKALNKSKMTLRRILSTLNKYLDTLEIKMCGKHWDYIKPHTIPINSAFKYHQSFCRHGVDVYPRLIKKKNKNPSHSNPYPYSNIKIIADRLINVCEMDKEVDPSPTPINPSIKTSEDYMTNFNRMVQELFGQKTLNYLSIIDMSTLTSHNINTAIGFTCVNSSGAMIITPSGKNQFFRFSDSTDSSAFCDKVKELTQIIKHYVISNSSSTAENQSSSLSIYLKKTCLFLEKCFEETKTKMSENERKEIKFVLFSRQPMNILDEICKNEIFELSQDLYPK